MRRELSQRGGDFTRGNERCIMCSDMERPTTLLSIVLRNSPGFNQERTWNIDQSSIPSKS